VQDLPNVFAAAAFVGVESGDTKSRARRIRVRERPRLLTARRVHWRYTLLKFQIENRESFMLRKPADPGRTRPA